MQRAPGLRNSWHIGLHDALAAAGGRLGLLFKKSLHYIQQVTDINRYCVEENWDLLAYF